MELNKSWITDVRTVRTSKIIKAWTKRNLMVTVCSMNVPKERSVLVMLPLLHVAWSPNKAVSQHQEAAEPGLPAKTITGRKKIYGTKIITHVNDCYSDLKQWFLFQLWRLVIVEAKTHGSTRSSSAYEHLWMRKNNNLLSDISNESCSYITFEWLIQMGGNIQGGTVCCT